VNRKLIRTTLADVKAKGRDAAVQPREQRVNGNPARPAGGSSGDGERGERGERSGERSGGGGGGAAAAQRASQAAAVQVRKRTPPPTETSAEIFYYKKQIDAHTAMVITLQGGEEIEGTIEWYDRNAIKVNRKGAPNLLILKHNIKYMYKADEREGE
jgi:sRNA-binding regulator protein Hfq